jgi:PAS domain S-box-containing protein
MEDPSGTKCKKSSKAPWKSKEYFKAIIQNSYDVILVVDKLGTITYASPSVEPILGYGPDELIGKRSLDLIISDDKPRAIADFGRALLTNEILIPNIFRMRHKDGTERIFEGVGNNLLDNQIVAGFVMNVRDVTNRKRIEEELRVSEELFRRYLEYAPDGVYMNDLEGNFLYSNSKCEEIIGYRREELIGKNFLELNILTENSLNKAARLLQASIEGKSTGPEEIELITKEGRLVPVEVNTSVVQRAGQVIVLAFVRDITDRKQAEEALKENENKYRLLADNVNDVIFVLDMNLNYTYVSPSVKILRGYEPAEVLKQTPIETLTPSSRDLAVRTLSEVMELEKSGRREIPISRTLSLEMMRKDGAAVWTEVKFSFIRDKDQQPVGILGVTRDITDRRRAEEALESERVLLRNLIDNVPDRIYAKDAEGRFIICNEAMIRRMGMTRMTELVGKSDFDFLPREMAQRFRADEQAILQSGIPMINREEPLSSEDGTITRWNLATKVPLLDKQGNTIGIVGIGREITDRKQAEQKLQDTLESLRKAMNTTIQVMVSAVETRDPYTAGHQTRSADLARAIATEMGLPQQKIDGIRVAGSIHDIGKLSIPAEILSKPTKLSEIEFKLIMEHARQGYEILKDVESSWPLAEMVYQHHERMDGSGYPRGLKGEDILMEARILAVADVVEAMASHRPYRPALGIDAALEEISKNRGVLYDPEVSDACLRLFQEKRYRLN